MTPRPLDKLIADGESVSILLECIAAVDHLRARFPHAEARLAAFRSVLVAERNTMAAADRPVGAML